jgi:glycerol-3-phosphate dehydrogenase
MINFSPTGLLTIAGGKWTTYRAMASETIDAAISEFNLEAKTPCVTDTLKLVGTENWNRNMYIKLAQTFGLETDVAKHLANSYGDRAWVVAATASLGGVRWPMGKRLVPGYPYIEAEVRYAVRHEYACTAMVNLAFR